MECGSDRAWGKLHFKSDGTAVDTSVSFARQQQGEQTVDGVGVVFSVLWALSRHVTSLLSLMLFRWVPMMLWAVLIAHYRDLMFSAVHEPYQFVIFRVRMRSVARL